MVSKNTGELSQNCIRDLDINGTTYHYYSLSALAKELNITLERIPVCIRILLESVLRNCDDRTILRSSVETLARWLPNSSRTETPFVVSRVLLQDLTGVPLLVDIASMRESARKQGVDPRKIEPLVPVDLVVDHSVMIDQYGSQDALLHNMREEFLRNEERYSFLKWGKQAFKTLRIIPPGFGIVHQVNLEHLSPGVFCDDNHFLWPDSVVGTDSHTVMINGLGVLGWGVGGIEAEAAMLGQPIYMLTPDVIGVHLRGKLSAGCTTTDLALSVTQILREKKVVGKFVEFFGDGAQSLSVPERATVANMAPEYGATMGFFPVDDKTVKYLSDTGRSPDAVLRFKKYYEAQGLFGISDNGQVDYTDIVEINLADIKPCIAGPRRPQDRIELSQAKSAFEALLRTPTSEGGFALEEERLENHSNGDLQDGDILIAAITSCTNTSNPSVLIASGLLAKKAVQKGLRVNPKVKTSLAPGSRVVTAYLEKAGLLPYLEQLGFHVAAYGCTTCIGNSGDFSIEQTRIIRQKGLVTAAVLSGNRNFEARVHPLIKTNYLASPALVVAYAIAGSMRCDLTVAPLGVNQDGQSVYLKDIWPTNEEILELLPLAQEPADYQQTYIKINDAPGELWEKVSEPTGPCYDWPESSYIAQAPFCEDATPPNDIHGARTLGIFGDSLTTDHISPAGRIPHDSPAATWLIDRGISGMEFNSYGSRRGNHEIMLRGTFANVRIKNLMVPPFKDGSPVEGGYTLIQPKGRLSTIYDASCYYRAERIPCIVFGGDEYGTGSSRDWAAKGTKLLGVKAVIVKSFERIHRSNLIGMGVLPLQFKAGHGTAELNIDGSESFDILGLDKLQVQGEVTMIIHRQDGTQQSVQLDVRVDTPVEMQYLRHGGILPFMLSKICIAN